MTTLFHDKHQRWDANPNLKLCKETRGAIDFFIGVKWAVALWAAIFAAYWVWTRWA